MFDTFLSPWLEMLIILVVGLIVGYTLGRRLPFYSEEKDDAKAIGPISVWEVNITEQELEGFLKDVETWQIERFEGFLSRFMLTRELKVLKALATALVRDAGGSVSKLKKTELGWVNRNQIRNATGIPKRPIYSRTGIVARLVKLDLAVKREVKPGPLRRDTLHYRINTDDDLVLAYTKALIRSDGNEG